MNRIETTTDDSFAPTGHTPAKRTKPRVLEPPFAIGDATPGDRDEQTALPIRPLRPATHRLLSAGAFLAMTVAMSSSVSAQEREDTVRVFLRRTMVGNPVFDRAGVRLGAVQDFLLNRHSGSLTHLVVDTGGLRAKDRFKTIPVAWARVRNDRTETNVRYFRFVRRSGIDLQRPPAGTLLCSELDRVPVIAGRKNVGTVRFVWLSTRTDVPALLDARSPRSPSRLMIPWTAAKLGRKHGDDFRLRIEKRPAALASVPGATASDRRALAMSIPFRRRLDRFFANGLQEAASRSVASPSEVSHCGSGPAPGCSPFCAAPRLLGAAGPDWAEGCLPGLRRRVSAKFFPFSVW